MKTENATFATAFYDIGRGKWSSYKRTPTDYIEYFSKTVSKIRSNLVIYCEEQHRDEIAKVRPESDITKFVALKFEDLEMHKLYFSQVSNVMKSEEFKKRVIHHDIPEMIYPDYNILNFNKVCFVADSTQYFSTPTYGWIDFGFGHGKIDVSQELSFLQEVTSEDRVFMGCLRPPVDEMLFHPWSYFSNEIFITGSAFIGTATSITEFKNLIHTVIKKSLSLGMIDDDQTIYNMAYLLNPKLFNLKQGTWFNQFQRDRHTL